MMILTVTRTRSVVVLARRAFSFLHGTARDGDCPPVNNNQAKMMGLKRLRCDTNLVQVYEKMPKMADIVQEKVLALEENNQDDAFFIVDLQQIYRRLEQWNRLMPRVEPFYALKCNFDPCVACFLADLDIGFDCASKLELQQILNLGVHPSRIVYANPCKSVSHIQYATKNQVNLMTFDDVLELDKIKEHNPDAQLILRIFSSKEFKAIHSFDKKFGCHPKQVKPLLERAITLGLNVVGVSFHVGSLPEDIAVFASNIKDARDVFDQAKALGLDLNILDVGGGYPGVDTTSFTFEQVAQSVNTALDIHFPPSSDVRIIAEPGRYFASSAFTYTVNVIGKRVVDRDDDPISFEKGSSPSTTNNKDDESNKLHMYYVNDGVFGSFCNVYSENAEVYPMLLSGPKQPRQLWSCMWGPTCDGTDLVIPEKPLPEMEVGQWIYFHNMGAYTTCLTSDFNSIARPLFYYVCSEEIWNKVFGK